MYVWKERDSNYEPNHNNTEPQNTIFCEYRISNVNADRQKDMAKITGVIRLHLKPLESR